MATKQKSGLRKWLEAAGHFETLNSLAHSEFVRTLLVPAVLSAASAVSGVMGNIPVMWILMATAVVFAASVTGLLRGSEYIERKNPEGKLRIVQSAIGMDLVPLQNPNRAQRRARLQAAQPRQLDRMQFGVYVHNAGPFPLSIIVHDAVSDCEGKEPPRSEYPKPAVIIHPGAVYRCTDDRMPMDNMVCKDLTASYEITLKYGLPGKEKFELKHAATLDIKMNQFGSITGVNDAPQPEPTDA